MYTVLSTFAEVMSRFGSVYDTIMIAKVRVCVYRKTSAKVCDICRKCITSSNLCDSVVNCKLVSCANFAVFDLEHLICCSMNFVLILYFRSKNSELDMFFHDAGYYMYMTIYIQVHFI